VKRLSFSIILILLIIAASDMPQAKVTGECYNCHTMHYSQGGGALAQWGQSGPYSALTTNTCVGCHTAASGIQNTGLNTTPYVMCISTPAYGATGTEENTIAGGSFYWMKTDETTGHDVDGIATAFDMLPPGYPGASYDSNRPATWPADTQVTCAGTYGCHGTTGTTDAYTAVKGGHHGDDSNYRMLNGVAGKEWNTAGATGGKWEFKPTNSKHNQYKAIHRASGDQTSSDTTTISYLCGQCHGNFHGGSGNIGSSSPWLRHPTDVQLKGAGTEYANYNTTDNPYSVVAPVGSFTVTEPLANVTPGTTNCIVTCISCHRAHGTQYYKIMRWDYKSATLLTALRGCVVCHTSKN
jgi:predicted CXXCH cytochrome family protein